MLNKSDESGYPCLVPDPSGNAFSFWPLSCDFSYEFVINGFYFVEEVPLCAHSLECWILSKAFSASFEMIIWFLFFCLFMWCITSIDLQILQNPCIAGINPTWSLGMIFLTYIWMGFGNILLRIFFNLCSSVILICNFLFLWYLFSDFSVSVMAAP